ncbi:MAG: phosphodiester glycosidase family protein [Arcanobacterium sp.]|nr:phosphodiester glycosidase family protein [Arcanobacterium sp.]
MSEKFEKDLLKVQSPVPRSSQFTAPEVIAAENSPEEVRGTGQSFQQEKKRGKKKPIIIGVSLSLLLGAAGTAAWAVDEYLIPKVEISDVAAYEAAQTNSNSSSSTSSSSSSQLLSGTETSEGSTTTATVTENSYTDENTSITITKHSYGSGDDTVTYYVADIQVTDASQLRSAFANNQFGENITAKVSEIAEANNAVLAINGDYYGFRDTGIVIRNGVIYRDEPAREGLAIYADGTMKLYDETETSAQELLDAGVINTLSFGPGLVSGSEVISGIDDVEVDTNFGNHSVQGSHPRTGIGVIDENHFVFVVVDGRSEGYSRGVTMTEFAEIFVELGASTAYNLDGGGSAEMWFNGEVVNQPSNGGERDTSDILYIGGAS